MRGEASEITASTTPILLVEDEEIHVELMERAAARCGLSNPLVVASDGQAALDLLFGTEGRPARLRPALVLLDLKMPGVDGLEVLAVMKRDPRLALIPVIVFSCSDAPKDVRQAYTNGANAYLVKPMGFQDSCRLLTRLMQFWLEENTPPPR